MRDRDVGAELGIGRQHAVEHRHQREAGLLPSGFGQREQARSRPRACRPCGRARRTRCGCAAAPGRRALARRPRAASRCGRQDVGHDAPVEGHGKVVDLRFEQAIVEVVGAPAERVLEQRSRVAEQLGQRREIERVVDVGRPVAGAWPIADLVTPSALQREADAGAVRLQVAVDQIADELAREIVLEAVGDQVRRERRVRRRRDLLYAADDVLDRLDRAGDVAEVDVDRRAVRADRAVERRVRRRRACSAG